MSLQERLMSEYKVALKAHESAQLVSDYRFLIGELQRQHSKVLTDDEVIVVFRKLYNGLSETPKMAEDNAGLLKILNTFLPTLVSDDVIRNWIVENIDFSKYKNKMQAMKDIMAHFKNTASGQTVKNILGEM